MIPLRVDRGTVEPHPRPEWFSGPVHIQDLRAGTETRDLAGVVDG